MTFGEFCVKVLSWGFNVRWEDRDRGDISIYMTEVIGLLERVNSRAAGCWDDQRQIFLASLCNTVNIKALGYPRTHVKRGAVLLGSITVGIGSYSSVDNEC